MLCPIIGAQLLKERANSRRVSTHTIKLSICIPSEAIALYHRIFEKDFIILFLIYSYYDFTHSFHTFISYIFFIY